MIPDHAFLKNKIFGWLIWFTFDFSFSLFIFSSCLQQCLFVFHYFFVVLDVLLMFFVKKDSFRAMFMLWVHTFIIKIVVAYCCQNLKWFFCKFFSLLLDFGGSEFLKLMNYSVKTLGYFFILFTVGDGFLNIEMFWIFSFFTSASISEIVLSFILTVEVSLPINDSPFFV